MFRTIASDADAVALVERLGREPPVTPLTIRLGAHTPRSFASFLGGVLQRTTEKVTIQNARLLGERVDLEDAWPPAGAHVSDLTFLQCLYTKR